MYAAIGGRNDICMLLIEKLADQGGDIKKYLDARDSDMKDALDHAMFTGQTNVSKLLDGLMRLCRSIDNESAAGFILNFNECVGWA
jgi:hypothetical protein